MKICSGAAMFSVKNVYPKMCSRGYGVLALIFLMGVMAGCSSRTAESDRHYSSGEGPSESMMDKDSLAHNKEPSSQPTVSEVKPIPSAPYSSADREVVLKYAEKGENDSANLEQALKLVQRAEQLPSTERKMEDYLILTAHYWFKGDMKQVIQYANQGIMAKSDNPRVKAHMFIYLGYTNESNSPAIARSYFQQAARMDPVFYKGHYELGRILFQDKKYSEAKAPLEKAFSSNPESADVYGKLGQMFYSMDQYEKAAESLEKALAMSPETHWLHLQLGDTYFYGLKKREEGGRHYQQAVSKNESDPEAHFAVALYYRYESEYKKAAEHLQKAMTLDHKNPKYKREFDEVDSEKQEIAKGIQRYQRAIDTNPSDPDPVTQLGRFYQRWGKFEQAEEQFKKSVQLASIEKVSKAAVVDPESGETMEPAVVEPSKVPEYANHLGWFYLSDKKYSQAEKAFKTALKVDPKYSDAQFGLGQTYENLKQYDLAASYYAETVASNPKHEEAQMRLDDLKNSNKLMPVGEVVKPSDKKKIKKSVMKVRK
jgi:tetratricopeptide (TPR) repeat protein